MVIRKQSLLSKSKCWSAKLMKSSWSALNLSFHQWWPVGAADTTLSKLEKLALKLACSLEIPGPRFTVIFRRLAQSQSELRQPWYRHSRVHRAQGWNFSNKNFKKKKINKKKKNDNTWAKDCYSHKPLRTSFPKTKNSQTVVNSL